MSTATAHPNIALIKYWGKLDESLIIPSTSSIAVTLAAYESRTTVTLSENSKNDIAFINGEPLLGAGLARISRVLDRVRELAESTVKARVVSENTVPTAAGLASSASGFAALAVAAAAAYGLNASAVELSRIARLGSGSASRSIYGDFSIWHHGETDETSFAEPLIWQGEELAVVVAVVSAAAKAVSSRSGMQSSVETSPFYRSWVETNNQLVLEALQAINDGNLEALGELTEKSTMMMHAVMLTTNPSIRYLTGQSLEIFDSVRELRESGVGCWATADAGPNVKILTRRKDSAAVAAHLSSRFSEVQILESQLGGAARLVEHQP